MTVSAPSEPMLPPRRRPWGILVLVAVVLAVIGYLAFSSVGSALVYYVTPTELLDRGEAAVGETVRLGGLVEQGSVAGPATDLTFVVTDGENGIEVHSTVAPTRSFREGSGAVVEGALGSDGVFEATRVIVKHDENYEVPASGEVPSDQVFEPGADQ
ncbi:MAG TPA: cytochrome c maturation protein CcmE [Candidatus Limnocylindria bacterium]